MQLSGRTPLIYMEVSGEGTDMVSLNRIGKFLYTSEMQTDYIS